MKRKITNRLIAILISVIMLFGMPVVLGSNGAWAKTVEDTQITESETPKANAKIKTQSAPTDITGGMEKITGTTTAMEYAASSDTEKWTGCGDGTTAVKAGTWYVRFKETKKEKASSATKVTVSEAIYAITATPTEIVFNNMNAGYKQQETRSVKITNTGNSTINLSQPSATNFDVGTLSTATLESGDTATFTVRPNANLTADNYNEIIKVNADKGANAEVNVAFKVNEAFTSSIIEGENHTLKAIPEGGSGIYTYQWYEGSSATAFSTAQEVKVSPTETTTYKVVINDKIEEKAATVIVTVAPADHTIVVSPTAIEFAARNTGYTQPDAQTVKITNNGNSSVRLNQLSSTNYDVGALTKTTLEAGETAAFTVRPKANLAAGSYNETIKVSTDKGTSAEVKVNFKVNKAFAVTISPNNPTITKGQSQTLKANPEGGSGNYTYQWYEGSAATAFSTTQEVKVSPAKTTTYKVVVSDTSEEKAAIVMVTVTSKSQQAPKIISGANRTWTKGSKSGISFTSDADFSEFLRVSVDGKKIEEDNYTVTSGSIIVTLKPEYLKTLTAGKHTLGIVSERGTAETTFTILNSKSDTAVKKTISKAPQTGDTSSLALWSLIILILGIGIVGSIIINKINKNARK